MDKVKIQAKQERIEREIRKDSQGNIVQREKHDKFEVKQSPATHKEGRGAIEAPPKSSSSKK